MSKLFDRATLIKQSVTVPQALARYGFEPRRRMRCPIHGGDGLNFEVKEKTWKCYSQCGNGDVIELVQKLFNISFQEALEKIDGDFGLGLSSERDEKKLEEIKRKTSAIEAKQAEEQAQFEALQKEYDEALDRWTELDQAIVEWSPKTVVKPYDERWIKATQTIAIAKYELERAEWRLNRWKLTR